MRRSELNPHFAMTHSTWSPCSFLGCFLRHSPSIMLMVSSATAVWLHDPFIIFTLQHAHFFNLTSEWSSLKSQNGNEGKCLTGFKKNAGYSPPWENKINFFIFSLKFITYFLRPRKPPLLGLQFPHCATVCSDSSVQISHFWIRVPFLQINLQGRNI